MKRSSLATELACKKTKLETLSHIANMPPLQHPRVLELKAAAGPPTGNEILNRCFDVTRNFKKENADTALDISEFSMAHLAESMKTRAKAVSAHVLAMKNDANTKTFIYLGNVSTARYSLHREHHKHVLAMNAMSGFEDLDANLLQQMNSLRNETFMLKSICDHAAAELESRNNMYKLLHKEIRALRVVDGRLQKEKET